MNLKTDFIIYVVSGLIGTVIGTGIIYIFSDRMGFPAWITFWVAYIIAFIVKFAIMRIGGFGGKEV